MHRRLASIVRQLVFNRFDLFADIDQCCVGIETFVKLHGNRRTTQVRFGADLLHATDTAQGLLDRPDDQAFGILR